MYFFYSFLFSIFNACLCAHLAKKKGRNPTLWFMGGSLFGLFALAAIFFVPKQKMASKVCALSPPVKLLKALVAAQECKFWYYLDEKKEQFGPMSFEAVTKAWKEGAIQADTFLWNEDLEGWKRLDEVTSSTS